MFEARAATSVGSNLPFCSGFVTSPARSRDLATIGFAFPWPEAGSEQHQIGKDASRCFPRARSKGPMKKLIFVALAAAALAAPEKLVIKGSDTLGAKLVPTLAEEYRAKNPN